MCRNFATLATAIADRNLDALSTLMFLHIISAVSWIGLCPEAASEMSSHNSSWFWRTFACPEENTLLLCAIMASCRNRGSRAISIAASLDPLAYCVHGGPSPRRVSLLGAALPELAVLVGSAVAAGAVAGSESPIRRSDPCLPEYGLNLFLGISTRA
jgi:hypothetical protein